MSAVLRAGGVHFDVDAFCSESALVPDAVYRAEAPVFPGRPGGPRHDRSGIHVVVSEADFEEFERQVRDVTAFLLAHRAEVRRLVGFPGVERVELDFGVARRDVVVQCDRLPPDLVRVAGELGLWIAISQYPRAGGGDSWKVLTRLTRDAGADCWPGSLWH